MRRLPRILLNAATAASLVLCVATVVLWVRSRNRIEGVGWRTPDGHVRQVFSDRGRLCVDRVGRPRIYGEPIGRLRDNRVTLLPVWRYSLPRPPERVWGMQDVEAAGDAFPYHRWGFAVSPNPRPRPAFAGRPGPPPRVVPSYCLHLRWEDEYSKWGWRGVYTRPSTLTRDVDRWGVRVLAGDRDAPIWTDEGLVGMGDDAPGLTVAVAWWLPVALLAALPAMRASSAVRRRLKGKLHPGLCPACGYDLRATPDRCPECGTMPAS